MRLYGRNKQELLGGFCDTSQCDRLRNMTEILLHFNIRPGRQETLTLRAPRRARASAVITL